MPVRLTRAAGPPPAGVMLSVAFFVPAAAGAKATVTVQVPSVGTVAPAQVPPVTRKSPQLAPCSAIAETVLAVGATLVTVIVRLPLVCPAGWCPKSTDAASACSGPASLPETVNVSVWPTTLPAVSKIANLLTGWLSPGGTYVPPTTLWNARASPR